MRLSANHNIEALNVRRTLSKHTVFTADRIQSLGSGLRITKASVDASGVAISEGFRAQITRMGQSVRNAEQASDLLQVAEGSLENVIRRSARRRLSAPV